MAVEEGFTGMAALVRGLQDLGEAALGKAEPIVKGRAERMAAAVRRDYKRGPTGNLQARVVVEQMTPLRFKVRSKAPHAHLYEYGTVQRFTHAGANRGTMPATPVFTQHAVDERRGMRGELIDMMRGLQVPGMSGSMEVVER